MNAPDKIYILTLDNGARFVEYAKTSEHCDEYIRKDALLEWLESKVYQHNEDKFDDGFNTALGQVIDKLNSF